MIKRRVLKIQKLKLKNKYFLNERIYQILLRFDVILGETGFL